MTGVEFDRAHSTDTPGALVIGGDFQGLGVMQSLARRGVQTFLVDSDLCIGRFSRHKTGMRMCPDSRDESALLAFLKSLAKQERLHGWVVYANDDETVKVLSRHKRELEESYRVPVPTWDRIRRLYDKRLTYRLAEEAGVPAPRTWYPKGAESLPELPIDFPVIVKPAIRDEFYRRTRCKAVLSETREDLLRAYNWAAEVVPADQIMVQELIGGGPAGLGSLGAFFKDGKIVAGVTARRSRQHPMDFGHATTFAETVRVPEIENLGERILRAADFYGLAEVEFMLDPRDNTYKLIEVNGRVWGWHTLARAAGVDLPYILYRDAVGMPPSDNGCWAEGVKWMRPITDVPTAVLEILGGRMKLREYLGSLRACREIAPQLAWDDPLPFFAEFGMVPYLWKKRGF